MTMLGHYMHNADAYVQLDGCGSGGRAGVQIGSSIPGSSSPCVSVSLGEILNPKLLLMTAPMMCGCVSEC